jgi:hypothetical protein
VRSSAQASAATATQQISRRSHLMVRCRYQEDVQVCAGCNRHSSLLMCVVHTAVQVLRCGCLRLTRRDHRRSDICALSASGISAR